MSWDDDALGNDLGMLWEALTAARAPMSAAAIKDRTGLPSPRIRAGLGRFAEIGLLEASAPADTWRARARLDALAYARAVELGIPLDILERTVGVSVQERTNAQRLADSGVIDAEREQRLHDKAQHRQLVLRGRAATRAATTDLARIVQDTQAALGGNLLGALDPHGANSHGANSHGANSHGANSHGSSGRSHGGGPTGAVPPVATGKSGGAKAPAKSVKADASKCDASGGSAAPEQTVQAAVQEAVRREAAKALDALVSALERAR